MQTHLQSLPSLSKPFAMIFVEGGKFFMGAAKDDKDALEWEQPQHEVKVSSFYMGQCPVTQSLWMAVMGGENPSRFQGDERPVEQVSWEDAQVFLKNLNKMSSGSRPAGFAYRLPAEAEWEYSARGGIYWGDGYRYAGSDRLKDVGWFDENSKEETKPVGLKYPNQLGLHDMSGNVWEWCEDWYGGSDYYESCKKKGIVENPHGPEKGSTRVLRGGSWLITAQDCRAASRNHAGPGYRHGNIGFRLALCPQSVG